MTYLYIKKVKYQRIKLKKRFLLKQLEKEYKPRVRKFKMTTVKLNNQFKS